MGQLTRRRENRLVTTPQPIRPHAWAPSKPRTLLILVLPALLVLAVCGVYASQRSTAAALGQGAKRNLEHQQGLPSSFRGCDAREVRALAHWQDAGSTGVADLIFTHPGLGRCSLLGVPILTLTDHVGRPLRVGQGGRRHGSAHVLLSRAHPAHLSLQWINWCGHVALPIQLVVHLAPSGSAHPMHTIPVNSTRGPGHPPPCLARAAPSQLLAGPLHSATPNQSIAPHDQPNLLPTFSSG